MAERGSGGSRARRRQRQPLALAQLAAEPVRSPFPPLEILSEDEVERIHEASLRVLEEIGVEARDLLARAGAEVEAGSERVRFEPGLITEAVALAPSRFTMHGRDPAHTRVIGDDLINFCMVSSPPNSADLEGGRRPGNFADYCDFIRLGQSLNMAHFFGGYPVEPTDIPTPIRHLKAEHAMATLSAKNLYGYALGRERILDSIEIARIARGLSETELLAEPSIWTVVNANSPLKYDSPMLLGVIEMARRNQPIIFTPFTLAGAMAPVTIIGALVQQNAEALAGIAFAQIVKPGCPVMYGGFTSNVDMKSGAPAFGTPEYAQAVLAGGQLARRYGLPYRSSNVNASNAVDAQATYESEMSLWACILSHCNCVKHGLGWLEGGLTASFEKVILDAEMIQTLIRFLAPLEFNEATLGLDAMREVGPGGHYFGAAHTLERYEDAFYQPLLSDWRNFETWSEDGARSATTRAHGIYKKVLAAYQEPPMEASVRDELDAFVERRIGEGGAAPDW